MGFPAAASVIGELRNLIESRTQTKLSQLPPVTGAKPAEDSPEWSRVAFPLSLNLTALVSCIDFAARTRGNGQILKLSEPPFSLQNGAKDRTCYTCITSLRWIK